jgi:HlyD family secretion protein
LLRLSAEVGDTVKVGQLLGEMDPVDNDDRLRSQEALVRRTAAMFEDATARHTHAATQARRYEQLFAEKATSEELLAARRQDLQLATALHVRRERTRLVSQSDLAGTAIAAR